jgi:transcriptional regulator with XRE-family HTH domain
MSIEPIIGIPISYVNRETYDIADNNDGMSIGQRVREAREAIKMSQGKLGQAVGMSQPSISDLEKGESATTSFTASIAAALGVSALWLETGRGPRKGAPAPDSPEIEKIILLISLYKDASAAGRATILDAARFADKSSMLP